MGQGTKDYLKGSVNNPYTKDEYEAMLKDGTWKGGYVEGKGYVPAETPDSESESSEGSESSESSEGDTPDVSPDGGGNNGGSSGGSVGTGGNGGIGDIILDEVEVTPSDSNGGSGQSGNQHDIVPGDSSNSNNGNPNAGENAQGGSNPNTAQDSLNTAIGLLSGYGNGLLNLARELQMKGAFYLAATEKEMKSSGQPYYDPNDNKIHLPSYTIYSSEELVHEMVHYQQNAMGLLGSNCSSNNEFQAYVMVYVLFKGSGNDASDKLLCNSSAWMSFKGNLSGKIWKGSDNELYYNQELLDLFQKDEETKWSEICDAFVKKCKEAYGDSHQAYYNANLSSYAYRWKALLTMMGAKFVK